VIPIGSTTPRLLPPQPRPSSIVDPRVGDLGPALLALEDGTVFPGIAFGAPEASGGDLVVNTSQTGYQEVCTDPSYAGQIVVMTYPLIGNYGRLVADDQSLRPWLRALVVANATAAVLDDARQLAALLRDATIPAIAGVDTRALARLHPVDLLSQVLVAMVERSVLDPGTVDDLIVGCVSQAGEQSSTPGRQAWLAAGYPTHVPSVTIERKCGSSQQAIDFAAQGIVAGAYDIVIAAGVESMSRVPMGSARMGQDPFGPGVAARYPGLVPQGVSAELVAAKWGLSRTRLDEYAARSHARAAAARSSGAFDSEIAADKTREKSLGLSFASKPAIGMMSDNQGVAN
jgi:hypothetical protein